jgi:hypothetical protein
MKKYVLYKDITGYKITPAENYNALYSDANKIIKIHECYTVYDALLTIKHYMHIKEDQIIIKC